MNLSGISFKHNFTKINSQTTLSITLYNKCNPHKFISQIFILSLSSHYTSQSLFHGFPLNFAILICNKIFLTLSASRPISSLHISQFSYKQFKPLHYRILYITHTIPQQIKNNISIHSQLTATHNINTQKHQQKKQKCSTQIQESTQRTTTSFAEEFTVQESNITTRRTITRYREKKKT